MTKGRLPKKFRRRKGARAAQQRDALVDVIQRIEAKVDTLLKKINQAAPAADRTHFTVDEVCELLNRNRFTVREWCRLGRVHAEKHGDQWRISVVEIERLKNYGLLPLDPNRNC